jgi:23S rRNA pseudouridine2605 synthase
MTKTKKIEFVRLNKFLAQNGVASRRAADHLIENGDVQVNGKKVFELGIKIDPSRDRIVVQGKPLKIVQDKVYLMLNKPKGILTSMSDPHGRPCVGDLFKDFPYRVFPIGRLDYDSEGLILLSNDGDFALKITHPSKEVTKTYIVKLSGKPEPRHIQKLRNGVSIIGGRVSARHIEKIRMKDGSDQYDWYKIIITEGKNRQIRQMFTKIGFDVLKLQRVSIGRLKIGSLDRGQIRDLTELDLKKVFLPDDPGQLIEKKKGIRKKSFKKISAV